MDNEPDTRTVERVVAVDRRDPARVELGLEVRGQVVGKGCGACVGARLREELAVAVQGVDGRQSLGIGDLNELVLAVVELGYNLGTFRTSISNEKAFQGDSRRASGA